MPVITRIQPNMLLFFHLSQKYYQHYTRQFYSLPDKKIIIIKWKNSLFLTHLGVIIAYYDVWMLLFKLFPFS